MGFWDFLFSGNSNSNRSISSYFNLSDSVNKDHSTLDSWDEASEIENSEFHECECDQDDSFDCGDNVFF